MKPPRGRMSGEQKNFGSCVRVQKKILLRQAVGFVNSEYTALSRIERGSRPMRADTFRHVKRS
jgi:hypothetical protein